MTGDQADMTRRLGLTLPTRWFSDTAANLAALLNGLAAAWSALYALLAVVRAQTRLATASDQFLDLAAVDFFASRFSRRPGESDASFKPRLFWAMGRERVTRSALQEIAQQAGYSLTIFEAAQPGDTGAYNIAAKLAWNTSGGWGSLQMPFESLVTATPSPTGSFEQELREGLAAAIPAEGALWLKIAQ